MNTLELARYLWLVFVPVWSLFGIYLYSYTGKTDVEVWIIAAIGVWTFIMLLSGKVSHLVLMVGWEIITGIMFLFLIVGFSLDRWLLGQVYVWVLFLMGLITALCMRKELAKYRSF